MAQQRIMEPGQALITAPTGGLVKGQGYLDGSVFGVVGDDIAEGEQGYMDTVGAFPLPYAGGATGTANADAYWDPTAGEIYAAYAAGRSKVGTFLKTVTTSATICIVMIAGNNSINGESGDITGVEAGDGLTGGGVSGSVTLDVDFGTAEGTVCEGNDSRLSDARTPTAHEHPADEVTYTNDSLVGVTEVEGALDAIVDVVRGQALTKVAVTVANGQASGSSAANPTLVGGELVSHVGSTGCESGVMTAILNGDGSITVTLTDAQAVGSGVVNCRVQAVVPA